MITKPIIYTEEVVIKELADVLAEILEDKEILYIGEVFEKKAYPRENFSIWEKKYKDCNEIIHTIKRIREILESRVNIAGLKGKANPTMVIFNLKNNYNWKDKTEQELSGQVNTGVIMLPKKNDKVETTTETGNSPS